MKTIPHNLSIPQPRVMRDDMARPTCVATLDLPRLCKRAQIPMRVTGGMTLSIHIIQGRAHFYHDHHCWVGIGHSWRNTRIEALRVMEILAHGFHDYAARECLLPMSKTLFHVPLRPLGRPCSGARPMSARERMANMRARAT